MRKENLGEFCCKGKMEKLSGAWMGMRGQRNVLILLFFLVFGFVLTWKNGQHGYLLPFDGNVPVKGGGVWNRM